MAELRIALLGGFRVEVGGRAVPDAAWRRRKPAALLKLLALAPRHRLHREQLMELLWPELGPEAAAANLRKALHQARRALGDDGAEVVASTGELVALEHVSVDVDEFLAAVARARRGADPELYTEAVDLYGDGLLPDDRYEEWVLERRGELEGEYLSALDELAGLLEARGDLDGAARAVRRIARTEPLREAAHARLIRLYALAGRRDDALHQYEALREAVGEPGAETQRLYEEVRARQPLDPERSAELWERVGELRVLAGDTAGAAKAFDSALGATVSSGQAVRLRRKLAEAWLMQQAPEQAEPHLAAAEALGADSAERPRLVRLRATQAWQRGELDLARRLADESAELGEDPEDVAAAHETVAIVSHMRGEWREGLRIELQRPTRDDGAAFSRVFDIHHCIGQYHLYGDGLADDVEDYARRTLELAESARAVRAQAFAWCLLGESLLLHARWDEAGGCLERSCELHASFGTRSGALPWQRLAELAVCQGAYDEARAALRRAAGIATVSPMARHLWGRIHATAAFAAVEQGDAEAAARSIRAAAAAAARYGDCPTCSALLNPIAAEALADLGDAEGARAYAEAAAQVAGFFDSSAWRAMAESAAAQLDGHDRPAHLEAAAALYERAGQPYWAERARGNAEGTLAS